MLLVRCYVFVFFFNDTATTEIYTLSLHDALPILGPGGGGASTRTAVGMDAVGGASTRTAVGMGGPSEIGRAHV